MELVVVSGSRTSRSAAEGSSRRMTLHLVNLIHTGSRRRRARPRFSWRGAACRAWPRCRCGGGRGARVPHAAEADLHERALVPRSRWTGQGWSCRRPGSARQMGPRIRGHGGAGAAVRATTDGTFSRAAIWCCPPPARRAVLDGLDSPDDHLRRRPSARRGPAVRGRPTSPSSTAVSSRCPIPRSRSVPEPAGAAARDRARRLSETILHALEGTRVDCSISNEARIDQADLALALCRRHGFRVTARERGTLHPRAGRRAHGGAG